MFLHALNKPDDTAAHFHLIFYENVWACSRMPSINQMTLQASFTWSSQVNSSVCVMHHTHDAWEYRTIHMYQILHIT